MSKKRISALSSAYAWPMIAFIAGGASGQSAPAADAPSISPPANTPAVEEVVVTAQRRREKLQDVPIAVSAATSQVLASQGITKTEDLNQTTPGLSMSRIRESSTPFLRGVGNQDYSVGNEASNATYIDGVYMPAMPGGFYSFNSIERVEVLYGPQGTLFGRNATGGLIQIITKDPSSTPGGQISGGYGNYNTSQGDLYATTGITPWLAADLSIHAVSQGEGYGTNIVTHHKIDSTNESNFRSKWKAVFGQTSITASLDYSRLTSSYAVGHGVYPGSILIGGITYTGGYGNIAQSLDPAYGVEQYGGSIRIEHDLGWAHLVSLTAGRALRDTYAIDGDLTAAPILNILSSERNNFESQELQLISDQGSNINWIVGAFYFHDEAGYYPITLSGTAFNALGGFDNRYAREITDSVAGYGQATAPLPYNSNLTLGARYTSDEKRITGEDVLASGPVAIVPPGTSHAWSSPTFRAALDHKFTPDIMAYVSYDRGFKSGTYNTVAANDPPVRPEYIDAFQGGVKSTLFDDHLRLNAALFYYKYKDLQLVEIVSGVTHLLNAAAAEMKGGEVQLVAAPISNLTLRAGASYLDAHYTNFPNAPCYLPIAGGGNRLATCNDSGNTMVRAPRWTAPISIDYAVHRDWGKVDISLNYYYTSGFYWQPDIRLEQKPYSLVNAQISVSPASRPIELKLWVRNLFDTKYFIDTDITTFGDGEASAPPRTFGATITWRFGG